MDLKGGLSEIGQDPSMTQATPPDTAKQPRAGFHRWWEVSSKAAGFVAAVAIVVFMMVIVYDVVMRYVFNRPTVWAMEIAIFLFFASVFLGMGYTELLHGHVRVDVVVRRLPPTWQQKMKVVTTVISLVYCGFMMWAAALFTWKAYINDIRSQWFLDVRLAPVYVFMPIGIFLFFLQILLGTLKRQDLK